MFRLIALPNQNKVDPRRAKEASSIQYAIGNVELMHKETEEEDKYKRVKMERSKVGTK